MKFGIYRCQLAAAYRRARSDAQQRHEVRRQRLDRLHIRQPVGLGKFTGLAGIIETHRILNAQGPFACPLQVAPGRYIAQHVFHSVSSR
jgi:hypothetical protein